MGGKMEAGISLAVPTRGHCPICCALGRWEPAASEVEHFLLDPRAKEAVFVIMLNEWYSPIHGTRNQLIISPGACQGGGGEMFLVPLLWIFPQ